MWFINYYGYFFLIITLHDATANFYPILPKHDQNIVKDKYLRQKRQFGFQDGSGENTEFGQDNEDYPNNGIFFDEENTFQDFVMPDGRRGGNNNDFPRNPNFFDNVGGRNPNFPGLIRPTTQRPLTVTSVNIPGMGTTRSACEDRCLTTAQYNPVCGDNKVTYVNIERFNCAVRCGRNVQIAAYRACPRIMV